MHPDLASATRLEHAVAAAARSHGDRVALEHGADELSYAELWDQAGRWSRLLAPRLSGRRRVALVVPRTTAVYAAYLGILRAGGTVVPVRPDCPEERLGAIVAGAGTGVAVWPGPPGPAGATVTGTLTRLGVHVLRSPVDDDAALSAAVDGRAATPADTAYVLFTSGSTGVPKGVPISHANALAFVRHAIEHNRWGPGCRLTQCFDLTFDVSVHDLFGAWCSGATLVVPDPADLLRPVEWVVAHGITHWASVPSVITAALAGGRLAPGCMPGLRRSVFMGEPLTLDQARAWADAAPASEIENFYGPTELTIGASSHVLPADPRTWPSTSNGTVPIGRVYPHLEWRLRGTGTPSGGDSHPEVGELCVRGSQRFAGYLARRDDRDRFCDDADRLVRDRAVRSSDWYRTGDLVRDLGDGRLLHLGRLDDQVKVRGFRVELGDVEAGLRAAGAADATVVCTPGPRGHTDLVAFLVGTVVPEEELRERLARVLPQYMVPRTVVWTESLPLTISGKKDRQALVALAAARA